jgi:hypothetical protein
VTDGVDPAVKGVKPPGPQAVIDCSRREARGRELPARDHPVLSLRDLGDNPITWSIEGIYSNAGSTTSGASHRKSNGLPRGSEGSGEGRNRTGDTMIFSHVLYRLSYLARESGC